MLQTIAKFLERRASTKQLRRQGIETRKPACQCAICKKPIDELLEAAEPLGPQFIVVSGKQLQVHTDCYFESLGALVEAHPIGRRPPRGCGDPR